MPSSHRDATLAVGLAVFTLVIWGLGWWGGQTAKYYGAPEYEQERQAGARSDQIESGAITGASRRTYQNVCENPQDERDADLCQQWRNANAARDTAVYSLYQVLLGILGIVGLSATIYFARDAARAGHLAVEETRRIGQAQTRSYLSSTGGTYDSFGILLDVRLNVKNSGQSPATKVNVIAELFVPNLEEASKAGANPWTVLGVITSGNMSISAGGDEDFVLFFSEGFQANNLKIIFEGRWFGLRGTIHWFDVFGNPDSVYFTLSQSDDQTNTLRHSGVSALSGTLTAGNNYESRY